jgi:hypothetical protein
MFGPFIIKTNHEFRSLWEIALLTSQSERSIYAKEKKRRKKMRMKVLPSFDKFVECCFLKYIFI